LNLAIATYTYAGQEHFVDDEVTVYGSQGPDLTITKVASPTTYSVVNETIQYTVVVTNTGNVTLTNVLVTDPQTGLSQTISTLVPGGSRSFNPTYRIVQGDINRGYFNNTATASYTYATISYSESASATVTANIGPEIDITKTVQESSYSSVGNMLHYTLIVRNTGNVTLTGISVEDPFTGIDQIIQSLDPGESFMINTTHSVTQNDINAGRFDNTATAIVDYAGTTYSDQDSATVPASQNPEINIIKTLSKPALRSRVKLLTTL
jgi:uncharacterized repeat protein (TIGR01451 family)